MGADAGSSGATMQSVDPSTLADALLRCAELCEETLETHRGDPPAAGRRRLASTLMLAVGALETAARVDAEGERSGTSLMIAATLAREAAEALRRYGSDAGLRRCAAACDGTADLCDEALRPVSRRTR